MRSENKCQPDINVVVSSKTEQISWVGKAGTLDTGKVHISKLAFQEYSLRGIPTIWDMN